MTYRHIVLFRIREGVPQSSVDALLIELRELGTVSDAVHWHVEPSCDERKGTVLVEDALFPDEATFKRFRRSPAHQLAASHAADIADWLVGDYTI